MCSIQCLRTGSGHTELVERLLQDLQPAQKLPVEDLVRRVGRRERPARVGDAAPEVLRCELELLVLDPVLARARKEEADHRVREQPLHEPIHDPPQHRLTTEVVVESHSGQA